MEQRLISKVQAFMKLIVLPLGQRALAGQSITRPIDESGVILEIVKYIAMNTKIIMDDTIDYTTLSMMVHNELDTVMDTTHTKVMLVIKYNYEEQSF